MNSSCQVPGTQLSSQETIHLNWFLIIVSQIFYIFTCNIFYNTSLLFFLFQMLAYIFIVYLDNIYRWFYYIYIYVPIYNLNLLFWKIANIHMVERKYKGPPNNHLPAQHLFRLCHFFCFI